MLNPDVYVPLLVIIGLVAAAITGLYLALVMGSKWGLTGGYLGWTVAGSTIASAVVTGIIVGGIISSYGLFAGFIANFFTIPLVGLVWLFIVGGNKALERILGVVVNKLAD